MSITWPDDADVAEREAALAMAKDSDAAIALLGKRRRRTCVQAGGHIGLWPLHLSGWFQRVITFEGRPENFACLARNVQDRPNIEAHSTLLGEAEGEAIISPHKGSGSGYAVFEPGNRVVTIDGLELDDLDLLCLDVEGQELPTMRGAAQTIKRCRPVILYEERGHCLRYGLQPQDTADWLTRAGYHYATRVHKDRIWVPC